MGAWVRGVNDRGSDYVCLSVGGNRNDDMES